jgi:hypothetical protein
METLGSPVQRSKSFRSNDIDYPEIAFTELNDVTDHKSSRHATAPYSLYSYYPIF